MSVQQVVEHLRPQFRGQILTPADQGYEPARKVYNGMIDKRPGAIARCANAADVMAAVRAGREQDVLTAVRGGGHNAGGLGICEGGLVIARVSRGMPTLPWPPVARNAGSTPEIRAAAIEIPARYHSIAPSTGSSSRDSCAPPS